MTAVPSNLFPVGNADRRNFREAFHWLQKHPRDYYVNIQNLLATDLDCVYLGNYGHRIPAGATEVVRLRVSSSYPRAIQYFNKFKKDIADGKTQLVASDT